jgi:Tfp pilus assembly protein FimT
MTFYTKLKKQKRLNRGFSSSFTVLELVIVLIIIGILAYVANFSFFNTSLQVAADNLIKDIRYTQSLALKEDKYQPFPAHACDGSDEGKIECNRSKYWFKQWWQLKFSSYNDKSDGFTHYYYQIFTDLPYKDTHNFERTGYIPDSLQNVSIAKDPFSQKLLIGHCSTASEMYEHFPDCSVTEKRLDLTETYGIKKIIYINLTRQKTLIFDNFGYIFLSEGEKGDKGDINPLDINERVLLTKTAKIKLCTTTDCSLEDIDHCIQINITPAGYIFKSKCE